MFPPRQYPNLIVGLDDADDAAVYRLSGETALIQTVDFFTPIVDDPYDYGAIAAANALSDVYAMGGDPILALNICAFPRDLPADIIAGILKGGADKVAESGSVLAGGHTIDDDEPKYGLCVTGLGHPEKLFTKTGALPGDILVLTKPLGTGIITTALKGGEADAADVSGAVASMKRLNRGGADIFRKLGVKGCTDVTGFGLMGHAFEMAGKSGVTLEIDCNALPFLNGAKRYAAEFLFPAGANHNLDYYGPCAEISKKINDEMRLLLASPETSGGLLALVPEKDLERCRALFRESGEECFVIGRVVPKQEKSLKFFA